mmetsp:Transcript_78767/g.144921  ORF Transcript_78767/g.144921 Transcript_78767/m.144921 type:complete len:309 (+) Transcript_78767:71-997(+)
MSEMTLGAMVPGDIAEIEQVLGPFLQSMQDSIEDVWPSVDSELVLLHLICLRHNLRPPTWWPHWAKRPIIAADSRPAWEHNMAQLASTGTLVQCQHQRTRVWTPHDARHGRVRGSALGTTGIGASEEFDLQQYYQDLNMIGNESLCQYEAEDAEVACKAADLKSAADPKSAGRAWDWNRLSPEPGAEPSPTPRGSPTPRASPTPRDEWQRSGTPGSEPHAEPQPPTSTSKQRRPQSAVVHQRVKESTVASQQGSPARPPHLRGQRPLSAGSWVRIPRSVHRPRDRPYSSVRRINETPDIPISQLLRNH